MMDEDGVDEDEGDTEEGVIAMPYGVGKNGIG